MAPSLSNYRARIEDLILDAYKMRDAGFITSEALYAIEGKLDALDGMIVDATVEVQGE